MKNENKQLVFPLTDPASKSEAENQGLTLLDYFAAKAMQGFTNNKPAHGELIEDMVEKSYKIAQVMLRERQKYL